MTRPRTSGAGLCALACASFLAAACGAPASDVPAASDRADIVTGTAPPAAGRLPSVVLLTPSGADAGAAAVQGGEPADTVEMDQYAMAFVPSILVVRPGTLIRFKNSEDVAHSVQVRSVERDSTLFNVGTVMGLPPFAHVFTDPGGYDVSCDVHPGMVGFVLVSPAAWSAVAAEDGTFGIEGVPPGTYTMTVWSRDAALRSERTIEVAAGRTDLGALGG